MPQFLENKKAGFDYEFIEKYEAGLVLLGHEAKALRDGQGSLRGSFISIRTKGGKTGLYLVNAQVPPYKHAGKLADYDERRERKLLLKKTEIAHLLGKMQIEGLTLVPLRIYTDHSFLKLEFALARGKKKYDKRETIKRRDVERRLRTLIKKRQQ